MGTGASACTQGAQEDVVSKLISNQEQFALYASLARNVYVASKHESPVSLALEVESAQGLDSDADHFVRIELCREGKTLCSRTTDRRSKTSNPRWHSQFLVCVEALPSDTLIVSVVDRNRFFSDCVMARSELFVGDILAHRRDTQSCEFSISLEWAVQQVSLVGFAGKARGNTPKPLLNLRLIERSDIGKPRQVTLYLVRHAESVWNEAQAQRDVVEMLRQKDHPLNGKGTEQAQDLYAAIQAQAKEGSSQVDEMGLDEQSFLCSSTILCSPLTRALQTALIALRHHKALETNSSAKLVLCSSLREKKNIGGMDSMGTAVGTDIVQRAIQTLQPPESKTLRDSTTSGMEDLNSFWLGEQSRIDLNDCQSRWWTVLKDSGDEISNRIQSLLESVYLGEHSNAIVVGHSLYFRRMVRECHLGDHVLADPRLLKLAQGLSSKKIANAGCAAIRITIKPEKVLCTGNSSRRPSGVSPFNPSGSHTTDEVPLTQPSPEPMIRRSLSSAVAVHPGINSMDSKGSLDDSKKKSGMSESLSRKALSPIRQLQSIRTSTVSTIGFSSTITDVKFLFGSGFAASQQ